MTSRERGLQGSPVADARVEPEDAGNTPAAAATARPDPAREMLDQLRRERADFMNYRRRIERDRAEDRLRERGDVLTRLLPFLDDLDRALAEVPGALEGDPWVRGIAISRSQLLAALRSIGAESFGSPGDPFDPALHDAEGFEVRPGISEPRVTSISRPGYRLGDRVLRPARVAVAGPGTGPASPPAEELQPWHV